MKEISDIISSYDKAVKAGKACALATVVHVVGSSYRRPGARMLVTDDGMLTGAISGGCLEGDALRKALLAISEGRNKLVTYDTTTDEDDAKFGVQLGCNGIVHILFEPVKSDESKNPIALLKQVMSRRRPAVSATLFSLRERSMQPGTCLFYAKEESIAADAVSINKGLCKSIFADMQSVLQQGKSTINNYEESTLNGFLQFIPPPVSIVIAGAGNDVMPLVNIAGMLGWEVNIVDGRQSHANALRFPTAKKIIVAKGADALQHINIDDNTVSVLMTHNYNYDFALLKGLLKTPAKYIGILGPKSKMQLLSYDLLAEGIDAADNENIYSPMGLDIGAETSEEIALSIAAEIKAVLMCKDPKMLRDKILPVHS